MVSCDALASSCAHYQFFIKAAQRSKPLVDIKAPVTRDMKKKIDKDGSSSASFKDLRLAPTCCMGFVGIFNYVEVTDMPPTHLECSPDKTFVPKK